MKQSLPQEAPSAQPHPLWYILAVVRVHRQVWARLHAEQLLWLSMEPYQQVIHELNACSTSSACDSYCSLISKLASSIYPSSLRRLWEELDHGIHHRRHAVLAARFGHDIHWRRSLSVDSATLVRFGAPCVHAVVDKAGAWPRHEGPIHVLLHHCVHGPRRQHQLPRRYLRQVQENNTWATHQEPLLHLSPPPSSRPCPLSPRR
jgi:hypothetical protein